MPDAPAEAARAADGGARAPRSDGADHDVGLDAALEEHVLNRLGYGPEGPASPRRALPEVIADDGH